MIWKKELEPVINWDNMWSIAGRRSGGLISSSSKMFADLKYQYWQISHEIKQFFEVCNHVFSSTVILGIVVQYGLSENKGRWALG